MTYDHQTNKKEYRMNDFYCQNVHINKKSLGKKLQRDLCNYLHTL